MMFKESTKADQQLFKSGLIQSPVFHQIITQLENYEKLNILDFGGAQPASVNFFNRFNCRYQIADAYPILSTCDKTEDETDSQFHDRMMRLFKEIIPLSVNSCLDLVLFWDGLNYVSRKTSIYLSHYLSGFCQQTGFLHCYIYGPRVIPRQWGKYNIQNTEQIERNYLTLDTKSGPAYSQTDLNNLLPEFKVHKSILLRSGMQEYMLRPDYY